MGELQLYGITNLALDNLRITYFGADAQPERLPGLAADLVKAKMDVIVTTGPRETLAARRATSSIPVVFTVVADPVGQGVVTNLARPESNVTGLTTIALPGSTRNTSNSSGRPFLRPPGSPLSALPLHRPIFGQRSTKPGARSE
jgi:ABC transporter substrate binding protein